MVFGGIRREIPPAIEKGIGRDIDNPHHPGLRQVNREAGGLPKHRGQTGESKKRGCEAPCGRVGPALTRR